MLVVAVNVSHAKSKNRLGEIQEMWRVVIRKKVSIKDERESLSSLYKISTTI